RIHLPPPRSLNCRETLLHCSRNKRKRPTFRDIRYTNRTRENDLETISLSSQGFFSGALIGGPVSRIQSGEWSAITKRTQRESQLDFSPVHAVCVTYASGAIDEGDCHAAKPQGDYQKAVAALSKDIRPAGINYFWLAAAYAAGGNTEKALATLQKAVDVGFHDFAALDTSPYFAALRRDPRFQQLMQRYRK